MLIVLLFHRFNTPPLFTTGAEAEHGAVQAVALASTDDRVFDWLAAVVQQVSMLIGMAPGFGIIVRAFFLNFSFMSTTIIPVASFLRNLMFEFQSLYVEYENIISDMKNQAMNAAAVAAMAIDAKTTLQEAKKKRQEKKKRKLRMRMPEKRLLGNVRHIRSFESNRRK